MAEKKTEPNPANKSITETARVRSLRSAQKIGKPVKHESTKKKA